MHTPTTPLAPPTREASLVAWLRLIRSRRVGATTFYRLMAEHGDADAALDALPSIARTAKVQDYRVCTRQDAQRELDAGRRLGARLVAYGAPDYPSDLMDIADAPPLIWMRGDISVLHRPLVALVGARNASSLGRRMARALAGDLGAAGFATVSGLARGIDTQVHEASCDTGTIAVMAGGLDQIYPTENTALAARICEAGALISEQPIGLLPQARHFPARNRLVSGLARALIVVEAAARSGSLITARAALDQGREVLAVPGHPFDGRASGCNMLLRDGATLIRGAKDVLEQIGPAAPETPAEEPAQLDLIAPETAPDPATGDNPAGAPGDLNARILDRLGPAPISEDALIRDLGLPAHHIAPALVSLELDGAVDRQAGGMVCRTG